MKVFNSTTCGQLVLAANRMKVIRNSHNINPNDNPNIKGGNNSDTSNTSNNGNTVPVISSNNFYFNVYVEDGNNSELIKVVVRKRAGWRVVESPAVANMIWSQFYRPAVDARLKGRNRGNHSPSQTDQKPSINK